MTSIDYQHLRGGREAAVFSDIDKTLLFEGAISPATMEGLRVLKEHAVLGIMTGRRKSSYDRHPVQHADIVGVENGCVIYVRGARDLEWDSYIDDGMEPVRELSQELGSRYQVEWKHRMFLVKGVTPEEKQELRGYDGEGVRVRTNLGDAEFFPAKGGKDNAIIYLSRELNIPLAAICGIGDDDNDRDALVVVGHPFTFSSSPAGLRSMANGTGYVTPHAGHTGIQDILHHIHHLVRGD